MPAAVSDRWYLLDIRGCQVRGRVNKALPDSVLDYRSPICSPEVLALVAPVCVTTVQI